VLVGGAYTAASDLYQVGRMLQDVLQQHPAFASSEASALVMQLLSKQATVQQVLGHVWLTPVGPA
jgi:hypothetical protein